jgi:hypothetical protein
MQGCAVVMLGDSDCEQVKALNIDLPSTQNENCCKAASPLPLHLHGSPLQRMLFSQGKCFMKKKKMWPQLHNYFRNSALCFNRGQTPWLKSRRLLRLRSKS